MLSSLKKWVQDVTVDLNTSPPRPSPSSSSFFSTNHYFYSTTPLNEQQMSRNSSSSAVYVSKPISMESIQSSRPRAGSIPPPSASPVELDLSHLNREEQEHIANVLKRARAVEEQQSTVLPVTVPSIMSPPASLSPSISSSSTSTSSFPSDQIEKYDNEIQDEAEKTIPPPSPESTFTPSYHYQIYGKQQQHENAVISFRSPDNELTDREIKNNVTLLSQQSTSIQRTPSPVSITAYNNHEEEEEEDKMYDNIVTTNQEEDLPIEEIRSDVNSNYTENQSIHSDVSRLSNLTEIDENDFFYEEPSPYESAIISNKTDEEMISSYKIDEFIDEDDNDERDHVKELEETIANLSRHFPIEQIDTNLLLSSSSTLPMNKIDTNSILEMEIESPSADELSSHPLSLSIATPIQINNLRNNLSRSSGIRENLTDLLIPAITTKSHHPLQRTLSTNNKRVLSIHRHKRNLPSVPNDGSPNKLQLRRANSESRFTLPAVPPLILLPQQNIDDESDLLEIDLNDPIGSMNRTLRSKTDFELNNNTKINQYVTVSSDNISSKVKQLRDQTTNTPPISNLNSSIKSKKKLKKKNSSPANTPNEQTPPPPAPPIAPPVTKLQKSTSTEITYPFPTTKLILNSSRYGVSHDLGFRITGGHSIPNCMDVTACIGKIDTHHRNYEILKNIVQEGDEVLELGGVSLRGKSALFVENLMNTIQNEFEILVRNQSTNTNSHSFLTAIDTNIPRRHSMDTSQLSPNQTINNVVSKSKSTSSYSLHRTAAKQDESTNQFSHRPRVSLLPNHPGLNGAGTNATIQRQSSNESDESDTLSQYFSPSRSRKSSEITTDEQQNSVSNEVTNASRRLQNFIKSDKKRLSRGSTSIDRKQSIGLGSFKFLKKKTKSVDLSHQQNTIINQLRENDYVGDIEIQIGHNSDREQLVVRIIRAKNLLPKDRNGFSDPFVKVYLLPGRDQENKRRIKHVSKTLNPVWDHTVIYGHMHREELQYKKLEFTIWDYDRFKANEFLGQITIDLKNPNVIDDKAHWYRLQAFHSREETANRGSSPRLYKMTSVDSSPSSTFSVNKNSVNIQPRPNQPK